MHEKGVSFYISKYLLVGIIALLGLGTIILSDYDFEKPFSWWIHGGKSVCNSLGCTMISAGLISLLLELSSIQKMIDQALKDLLVGKYPLKHYKEDELRDLNQSILRQLLAKNDQIEETICKYEAKLIDLTKTNYYEYHHSTTILTPDSKEKLFHKKVTIEYKLINIGREKHGGVFKWKIFSPKENLSDEEIKNQFQIFELVVCGETCKVDIQVETVSKNEYNSYDYIVVMKLPEKTDREYTVKCVMEYAIPYHDVTQVYKMTKPCKNFKHQFYMDLDKHGHDFWKIRGNAFTAFYGDQDNTSKDSDFNVVQSIKTSITISFQNWILPGAGYVILAQKEEGS